MNQKLKKILRSQNVKLVAIPDSLADRTKKIAENMNTTAADVLNLGLELLELSLGREVVIRKPDESVEMRLPILKPYKSIVKLKGEK